MSTTTILWNGSKWAGESADPIEVLIVQLESEPLDPTFEHYGNFASPSEEHRGVIHFFGNFLHVSHAFGIDSDDEKTIAKLVAAIKKNQARADYRAARAAVLASCKCKRCRPEKK